MSRTLSAAQVAGMLISASYGIGFLFGSGEMALSHGMVASVYGLATALGMALLACLSHRLWGAGAAIWDFLGAVYGEQVKHVVALLSMIWMAGVLAAQIHGGVAIIKLLGLSEIHAYGGILLFILGASRVDLRAASSLFSLFLLASSAVLVWMLLSGGGADIYLTAPIRFFEDAASFGPGELLSVTLAVIALVCAGSDYHQFIIAAKDARSAALGCALAAICLAVLSLLPTSVVLAFMNTDTLLRLTDPKQVIPLLFEIRAEKVAAGLSTVLLVGLSLAALGSGAAILRAMADALCSACGAKARESPVWALVALSLGGALAAKGGGILATMVSVNIVFVGSIAAVVAGLVLRKPLRQLQALAVIASGFCVSAGLYLLRWAGLLTELKDLTALLSSTVSSGSLLFIILAFRDKRAIRP